MSPVAPINHYENFPVASWLCPAHLRGAVRAIYHFARCADDIADEGQASASQRLTDLARYRQSLVQLDSARSDASLPAIWRTIFVDLQAQTLQHKLPMQPLHDLISAFEQDVPNPRYAHRQGLLDYCSLSANPVGRLLLHLYGINDAQSLQQSDAICSALQLANFWQDLSVDLPRGRCYLSAADLQQHGLSFEKLPGTDTANSRRLVADLVVWTRALMLEGAPLALRVPGRAGWELRFVVQGGLRILDTIARSNYNALTHRPSLRAARDGWPMLLGALTMRRNPVTAAALRDVA